jgi:hypothetical protein
MALSGFAAPRAFVVKHDAVAGAKTVALAIFDAVGQPAIVV